MRVFGRKKCTLVRVFFTFRVIGVFKALDTLDAFLDAPPLGFSAALASAAGAFFSAFD